MSRANLERLFPGLRGSGFLPKSPGDPSYNCAAFAAGEDTEWWDPYKPGGTWPDGIDREPTLANFVAVFKRYRFVVCDNDSVEAGFEKIALYADPDGYFAHAARQLPSGWWVSKLGELEDIEHPRLQDVVSTAYGHPVVFMKRPAS